MFFDWLKSKTYNNGKFKFSEAEARVYQAMSNSRLKELTQDLPKEFIRYNDKEKILSNNNWAIHHLFKKAYNDNKYPEAFLYFFYSLELNLKHFIMSEMMLINLLKFLEERKFLYSQYTLEVINDIQAWDGMMGKLINKFCEIHGKKMETDLRKINNERNYLIHKMMKENLSENQIEKSFKMFFDRTLKERLNFYAYILNLIDSRPNKIIFKIQELQKINMKVDH